MIRVLDRLVLGTFFRLFTLFVLGAPLLFILGDATEKLDSYMDRGLPLEQVGMSYLYQYVQFVFWSFPIAALLATIFTIQPMTVHREVMAAKAGGISFRRLVAPLLLSGFFLTGIGLALAEVIPHTNARSAELRGDRDRRQGWLSNFLYITDSGESLSARRLTVNDGRMMSVVLLTRTDSVHAVEPAQPEEGTEGVQRGEVGIGADGPEADVRSGETRTHIMAETAFWTEEDGWTLQDGYRRILRDAGAEQFEQFSLLPYPPLTERPEDLVETVRHEDEMTRDQLKALASRVTRSGGDPGRMEVKREQRLAIPVATLVIILFGAPLATSSKRGGAAFGVGLSLATTILYLVLFRVSGAMGYAGLLTPVMAAWLPNLIFLVGGLLLMIRVRT
jgi:lipopolysaccharide export system permease protein